MKLKKLNMRGFSHDITMVLVVVIVAIGGVAYLVGSHADSPPLSPYSCLPNATACTKIATVNLLTPKNGQTASGVFTISANITPYSKDGLPSIPITSAQALVNGKVVASLNPPASGTTWTAKWNSATIANGSYQIWITAVSATSQNSDGASVNSSGTSVINMMTVNNTPPATPTQPATLNANQRLTVGQGLTSANKTYQLILEPADFMTIYDATSKVDITDNIAPAASTPYYVIMQNDGNLVEYANGGQVLWASYTDGLGGTHVTLQNDGNLVISNAANQPVWSIRTGNVK